MRAHFGRKLRDIHELMDATNSALSNGAQGTTYRITKQVDLSNMDYQAFVQDFFTDQLWIGQDDGGEDADGTSRCIRVRNLQTGESVLVNSEGYNYPRYTALETIFG
jgi:hypothetical protein